MNCMLRLVCCALVSLLPVGGGGEGWLGFEVVVPDSQLEGTGFSFLLDDFNEDGREDLVVATRGPNGVWLFLGRGEGGRGGEFFHPGVFYPVDGPWQYGIYSTTSLASGDFTGDGVLDLATCPGGLRIIPGRREDGSPGFSFGEAIDPEVVDGALTGYAFVHSGDFNSDGVPDLVAISASVIWVLLAEPGADPPAFKVSDVQYPWNYEYTALYNLGRQWSFVGLIDKDGIPDIAAGSWHWSPHSVAIPPLETGQVLLGNAMNGVPDGTFTSAPIIEGFWEFATHGVAYADFNSDGVPDLLCKRSLFSWGALVIKGAGRFGNSLEAPLEWSEFPRAQHGAGLFAWCDLDSDGLIDATALAGDGSIVMMKGSATGSDDEYLVLPPVVLHHQLVAPRGIPLAADLDNDGHTDLVAFRRFPSSLNLSDQIVILRNRGYVDDGFRVMEFQNDDEGWHLGSTAPFAAAAGSHSKGRLDILLSEEGSSFGFWESPEFPAAAAPKSDTRGDATEPSKADLLYRSAFTVSSDYSHEQPAPIIRFRSAPLSNQQTSVLLRECGERFNHYFLIGSVPAGEEGFRLWFDAHNLNLDHPSDVRLSLERCSVETLRISELTGIEAVAEFDFSGGERHGFSAHNAEPYMLAPHYWTSDRGLVLRGTGAEGVDPGGDTATVFGYWGVESDVPISSIRLYRVRWRVSSNAQLADEVPAFRLRVNDLNLETCAYLNIESTLAESRVPTNGEVVEYDLWFQDRFIQRDAGWHVPNRFVLSFDYLHVPDSDNNPNVELVLEKIEITSFDPQ